MNQRAAQLGCVISHSLVGASRDYVDRFYEELPKTLERGSWDFDHLASLAKLNSQGYFEADETGVTATAGVFVAGDCRTKTLRQVATACSDGANAAIAACRYLSGGTS